MSNKIQNLALDLIKIRINYSDEEVEEARRALLRWHEDKFFSSVIAVMKDIEKKVGIGPKKAAKKQPPQKAEREKPLHPPSTDYIDLAKEIMDGHKK